jgi:ABC-type transport system involved in multi-copper enzyme maturation permease subunit
MNWLAWRQHRKQFMIVGIILALFAALMVPTGLNFWHTYQHALATCGKTNTCDQLNNELFQSSGDGLLMHLVPVAILFMPILLGLFWGVPFLSKEYADGTNKLVWTQSVSRRKWLSVKLIWILVGAAIVATCFAALDTWWSKTGNALNLNRFNFLFFNTQGIVPVAYAIFAVSVGIMFGAWFRRTMVALGVTLGVLIAVVLVVVPNFIRPNYETPINDKSSLSNIGSNGPFSLSNTPESSGATLAVSVTTIDSNNHPINWSNPPSSCIVTHFPNGNPIIPSGHHSGSVTVSPTKDGGAVKPIESQNGGPPVSLDCLGSLGYQTDIKYQPSYRYWDFQRIETALYLVFSVIPISATYWLVLKRDA